MNCEKIGVITSLIDKNNGIIIDYDGNEYNFSVSDFINDFSIEIGCRVLFKAEIYIVNNVEIKKATLIEQYINTP